jgi:eukaryotic-like serine/threonine-protein kinase
VPILTDRLSLALDGRYRIERHLGEGGMATVFLAEDLKHKRKVALKVLKPELAAVLGGERFVQEITTTAALQHPHILPLFDSGTADGFLYYVMPFIQGETLRDKLNRETQLGVDEAVGIASEVADALDYAHRNGVIHRDIKPENILLHDGRPVVADFGIALAVSAAAGGRMTETGLSLGTPHYMSPEQATGEQSISGRSDVYSLASVLYEMLAGQPPHLGGSAQQIIMKIIAEPAEVVTRHRKAVPPHIAAALAMGLEKLPADRFQSARAFAEALENPGFRTSAMALPNVMPGARTMRLRDPVFLGVAGFALVAGVAAAAAPWSPGEQEAPAMVTRIVLTMEEGQEFAGAGSSRTLGFSADGSVLAYRGVGGRRGDANSRGQLWRRRLSELESSPIPGTEGASALRVSRDGAQMAFRQGERLRVMPVEGGAGVWYDGAPTSMAWADDGAIYLRTDSVISRWVPGTATATAIPGTYRGMHVTDVLPGSRALLLQAGAEMVVLDLGSTTQKPLGTGTSPRYISTGHLVYARPDDGTLMVQPFDARTFTTTGPAMSTPDRVLGTGFEVGADGSLAYSAAMDSGDEQLAWVDRDGSSTPIEWIENAVYDAFSLSPDGTTIAAALRAGSASGITGIDIWSFNLRDRTRLPLTRDGRSQKPRWHPSGTRLLFLHSDSGRITLRQMPADGSGGDETLAAVSGLPADAQWTRDGRDIIIRMPGASPRNIFRFVPGEHDAPVPLLNRQFQERSPAPSPDANWLVYTSDQSGRDEVYAQPYPRGGAVIPVSINGGFSAVWSRDGREVLYIGADEFMWSARVRYDARSFVVEDRSRLFSMERIAIDYHRPPYDVASDGRFLVRQSSGTAPREKLILVRNWVQGVTAKK